MSSTLTNAAPNTWLRIGNTGRLLKISTIYPTINDTTPYHHSQSLHYHHPHSILSFDCTHSTLHHKSLHLIPALAQSLIHQNSLPDSNQATTPSTSAALFPMQASPYIVPCGLSCKGGILLGSDVDTSYLNEIHGIELLMLVPTLVGTRALSSTHPCGLLTYQPVPSQSLARPTWFNWSCDGFYCTISRYLICSTLVFILELTDKISLHNLHPFTSSSLAPSDPCFSSCFPLIQSFQVTSTISPQSLDFGALQALPDIVNSTP